MQRFVVDLVEGGGDEKESPGKTRTKKSRNSNRKQCTHTHLTADILSKIGGSHRNLRKSLTKSNKSSNHSQSDYKDSPKKMRMTPKRQSYFSRKEVASIAGVPLFKKQDLNEMYKPEDNKMRLEVAHRKTLKTLSKEKKDDTNKIKQTLEQGLDRLFKTNEGVTTDFNGHIIRIKTHGLKSVV